MQDVNYGDRSEAAEVVVLIGLEIARQAIQSKCQFSRDKLLEALYESLKTVVYQDKGSQNESMGLPEFIWAKFISNIPYKINLMQTRSQANFYQKACTYTES